MIAAKCVRRIVSRTRSGCSEQGICARLPPSRERPAAGSSRNAGRPTTLRHLIPAWKRGPRSDETSIANRRSHRVSGSGLTSLEITRRPSVKFLARGRLIRADASDCDFGHEIAFAFHRDTGHPTQHRDLSDVGERVGDRALKQFFGGDFERLFRRQVAVELLHGGEEALAFFFPRKRQGILPLAVAFGHGEGPVHQVADGGEGSYRRARSLAATVIGKLRPCIAG